MNDLKKVVALLREKNKKLDENLRSLNLEPIEVKIVVSSTRRYPDGNYRWTSASYRGKDIEDYRTDPRHPKMSYMELTAKKLEEIVVAKMSLVCSVTNNEALLS